ncbi:DNA replication licensing factor mcm3 [Porphyridium purpureum]|uniref:DNA replication licensing factor MCM3 n=1 Tax=Porphyridium purpureum TaxID=35688 RepID=A0A5J4YR23_PORPP|nr:DNA replication licensing factor mcm3 [Porphyridium purpureum]|eukprot:POR3623..scf236_6
MAGQGGPSDRLVHHFTEYLRQLLEEEGSVDAWLAGGDDGASRKRRFTVSLDRLRAFDPELAQGLLKQPLTHLAPFDQALQDVVAELMPELKFQDRRLADFRVGIDGAFGGHKVGPRTLSSQLVGNLVAVDGIVTRCTTVRPKLVRSVQYCPQTKTFHDQYYKDAVSLANYVTLSSVIPVGSSLKNKDSEGNPLEMEYGLSWFSDSQRITLQEMPESSPPGQLPRSIEVLVENDLVDECKPGDRVSIVGVFRALGGVGAASGNGIFKTVVVANNVRQLAKNSGTGKALKITAKDIENIRKLAASASGIDTLVRSIAPSICGFGEVKRALLLLLLGGAEKNLESGTHLRGDINILMVGDPSTAKSQLLRFVLKTAPLAISTTGRGSSGVGLTAAVSSDPETGERHLEAGAMVLADRGVVCIDEFDKMSDEDRVAIHEVMEQQTVTIAKAGIHASLNARCSVVAAANPLYGSYDRARKPHENIALPDSLLSRFDLLFIVLDQITPENDMRVAEHVLRVHQWRGNQSANLAGDAQESIAELEAAAAVSASQNQNHDGTSPVYERVAAHLYSGSSAARGKRTLSIEFLKKYIQYAKSRIKPQLTAEAAEFISAEYSELRTQQPNLSLPITARSLETIIRLATAHAKARLSGTVEKKDATAACGILKASLGMQTELQSEAKDLKKRRAQKKKRDRDALLAAAGDEGDPASPEEDVAAQDDNNKVDVASPNKRPRPTRRATQVEAQFGEDTEEEEDEEDGDDDDGDEGAEQATVEMGTETADLNEAETQPPSVSDPMHDAAAQTGPSLDSQDSMSLADAKQLLRSHILDLMGRHASVCSKSELRTRVRGDLPSDALFERALESLVQENLILVHDDSVFRV